MKTQLSASPTFRTREASAMHFLWDLKTVLSRWSHMQRSCYVQRHDDMKNYEEFHGYQHRVIYDEATGQFKMTPLRPAAELITLRPIVSAADYPEPKKRYA